MGRCLCPSGVLNDTLDGSCLPCQANCVRYWLRAMQTTQNIFLLLSFSQGPLRMVIPIERNLILDFNGVQTKNFTVAKDSKTENY